MPGPEVQLEDRADGVRVLTLSNPAKRNALDAGLLKQLTDGLKRPRADKARVRALLIQGAGDAFCSGYDLEGLDRVSARGPLPDEVLQRFLQALESHEAPSVALVRGPAFGGGCELACTCDFRIAADDAVFALPPARLGVVYASDGMRRMIDLVGVSRAKRMFLLSERMAASDAFEAGLVDEVKPPAEAEATALAWCAQLAAQAPLSIAGMRRTFRLLSGPRPTKSERVELEKLRRAAFRSKDAIEGRAAFQQKRAPNFTGR